MPCIRSPPQRRSIANKRESIDETESEEVENHQANENQMPSNESQPTKTGLQLAKQKAAAAAAFTKRNGPQVTVLPDTRTRIWELEGEIAKLERDKRFMEEERRKLVEEKEAELAEARLQFAQQLDSEKRRAQKELETCNAQWREEVEESNARHERREKDLERKLVQAKETLKADLDAEYSMKIEHLERERNRLRTQLEILEADVKDMEKYRSRCEAFDQEVREAKETHAKAVASLRESAETARKELVQLHQQELSTTIEATKAELRLTHAREMSEALDRCRQDLRQIQKQAIDALEAEMQTMKAKYEAELQSRDETIRFEQDERTRVIAELHSRKENQGSDARDLREKVKLLTAQNDSLRNQLWREQEDRAAEERKRAVEMEVAQQRTDEAVARALSIVKRTEDRMSVLARRPSSTDVTTRVPPPPPSRYAPASASSVSMVRRASVPSSASISRTYPVLNSQHEQHSRAVTPSRALVPVQSRMRPASPARVQQRVRASSAGPSSPNYLAQTHSSLIRSSTSPTDYDLKGRRFA